MRLADGQKVVEIQLRRQVPIGIEHGGHIVRRHLGARAAVGAGQPRGDLHQPGPGAQALGIVHRPHQGREPGQGRGRIGQPEAVIAVGHIVCPHRMGHGGPGHVSGHARPARLGPAAVAAGPVQHEQPGDGAQQTQPRLRRASRQVGLGQVRGGGDIGIHHRAAPVCGNGVDPGNGRLPVDGRPDLRHGPGPGDVQPGVAGAGVQVVGVLDGIGMGRGPGETGGRLHDHRAVDGPVEGGGARPLPRHLEAHRAPLHGNVPTVDDVDRGIGGIEGQFEHGEVPVGGHRVRPGHVMVEADGHPRNAVERGPHDIEPAGNGQVGLIEAVGVVPGKVRVPQQHAGPIGRHVLAEGPGIAAQLEMVPQVHGRDGEPRGRPRTRGGRPRRHGLPQPAAGTALDHLLLVQAQEVVQGRRLHPGGIAAGRGPLVRRGIPKIAVVSGEEATDQGPVVGGKARGSGAQTGEVHLRAEEGVALRVGNPGHGHLGHSVRAEILRPLPPQGHEMVGEDAQVVLGKGIALAIAQAAEVVGADMRNAEGGAANLGGIACPVGPGRAPQAQQGQPQ